MASPGPKSRALVVVLVRSGFNPGNIACSATPESNAYGNITAHNPPLTRAFLAVMPRDGRKSWNQRRKLRMIMVNHSLGDTEGFGAPLNFEVLFALFYLSCS